MRGVPNYRGSGLTLDQFRTVHAIYTAHSTITKAALAAKVGTSVDMIRHHICNARIRFPVLRDVIVLVPSVGYEWRGPR